VVSTREDALRFLEAPNVLTLALVDLGLPAADVRRVLSTLAENHPEIRRVTMALPSKPARGTARTRVQPLAQATLPGPWTLDSLIRVLRPTARNPPSGRPTSSVAEPRSPQRPAGRRGRRGR